MSDRTFTVDDVVYRLREITLDDQKEAQKIFNKTYSEAVSSGALLRDALDQYMRDQGLWDEKLEAEAQTINHEIRNNELKLKKGGIKLAEARDIALKIKRLRQELGELLSKKRSLDVNTADGQADDMRFNYLVSVLTVYNDTGKPYFKNLEDYLNKPGDKVGIKAAQTYARLAYGVDESFEVGLPENQFLRKYKLCDDNLRLIDKQGRFVTEDGRLIDENGRFINEEGQLIDRDGNLVDENGDFIVDFEPFLDDDGSAIEEPK